VPRSAERNVAPFVSASTSQDRNTRTYEYVPFLAPIGTAFTFGTQTPSGNQTTPVFKVTKSTSQQIPLFDLKILPGHIAYVALNGFDDDTAAKAWDQHWSEISKANSLILAPTCRALMRGTIGRSTCPVKPAHSVPRWP
jgi:carboxyl-terminal processing protease